MQRCSNAIAEYEKKYKGSSEGSFTAHDLAEIRELSGDGADIETLYKAIEKALEAGFMIGYRKAMRDARKAQRGER